LPRGGHALQDEDFDEINLKNDSEVRDQLFLRKLRNVSIHSVGDFVLVSLHQKFYDLYDKHGNLLRERIITDMLMPVIGSYQDRIITSLPIVEDYNKYKQEDLDALMDIGWSPSTAREDNPYIRIGRAIWAKN